MFELDVEKLKVLAQIMGEIPLNAGQNSITVTFFPGFQSGYFTFYLYWKGDNGELEFRNLDQAIEIAQKLRERAGR